MNATCEDRLASDFHASQQRSRGRREEARRARAGSRRRRGGGSVAAGLLAAAAVVAPLAIAQGGAQSSPAGSTGALLKTGSSGGLVEQVQRKLGVSPTGYYGPVTTAAVRRFQRANRLVVDGIAGPQTLGALGITRPAAPASAQAPVAAPSGTLARIAQCESGGNPRAVSRTGLYRGKYQFSRATWASLGGKGDPAAAPEAEQDRRAARLLAQRGTSPWPTCA